MTRNHTRELRNIHIITLYLVPTSMLISLLAMISKPIALPQLLLMVNALTLMGLSALTTYFYGQDAPYRANLLRFISIASFQLMNIILLNIIISHASYGWLLLILSAISVTDEDSNTTILNALLVIILLVVVYHLKDMLGNSVSNNLVGAQIAILLATTLVVNRVNYHQASDKLSLAI